jgi:hypothetical protein
LLTDVGVLVGRELLMITLLTAFGIGPASFMRRSLDRAIPFLLAPAFGLALGTSVFTTLIWFFPASRTFWLVPVLAVASCALALWRIAFGKGGSTDSAQDQNPDLVGGVPTGHDHRDRRGRTARIGVAIVEILFVALIVVGPTTVLIADHHSVGPVAFSIDDVDGYVAEIDGMQHESLHELRQSSETWSNPVLAFAGNYAKQSQNIDFAPLSANVNELFGWGSTQTQSPFLLAVILAGALGTCGTLIYAMKKRSWLVMISGGVFGAAMLTQLFFDGSQAAICGLTLILPLAVVALETIKFRRVADHVLFAVLAAGLLALYPLFVPGFVVAALIVLVALTVHATWNAKRLRVRPLVLGAGSVLAIAVMAAGLNVVAFTRDVTYWRGVLHGGYVSASDPQYALNLLTIPGWLAQSRGLYVLDPVHHSLVSNLLFAGCIPPLVAAIAVLGGWRNRFVWLLSALIISYGTVAIVSGSRRIAGTTLSCSYCVDRNLLPLGPVIGFLAVLGAGTLLTVGTPRIRQGTIAASVVVVLAVGYAFGDQIRLFSNEGFFLDTSIASVMSHYPRGASPLELEGFDEGLNAPAEQVVVADEAEEHYWGHISLPADYSDNRALLYVGTEPLSGPQFRSDYGYVLTRLSGVTTGRTVVARSGGVALERRVGATAVLVDSGVLVGPLQANPTGWAFLNPWTPEPIRFIVTGNNTPATVLEVNLRISSPTDPVTISATGGRNLIIHQHGQDVDVCVDPVGTALVRVVGLNVKAQPYVYLTSVETSTGPCDGVPQAISSTTTKRSATTASHDMGGVNSSLPHRQALGQLSDNTR